MKKVILFSMMCLMALSMQAQSQVDDGDYVDLGLPSGTLWKSKNEKGGFKTYDEAVAQFGGNLPTYEQWKELIGMCDWEWTNRGYLVTGPNGNSIFLPAAGCHNCDDTFDGIGNKGYYWSSTKSSFKNGSEWDYCNNLMFNSSKTDTYLTWTCCGMSIRLVKY